MKTVTVLIPCYNEENSLSILYERLQFVFQNLKEYNFQILLVNDGSTDQVFMVNEKGEHHFEVHGQVGFPFFGELILDCINRTENAMTQDHAFKAAELCVRAELQAKVVK